MGREIVPLISRETFAFSDVGGAIYEEVIGDFDLCDLAGGVLEVLVHGVNIDAGPRIDVVITPVAPSCDEPDVVFMGSTDAARVSLTSTDTAGSLRCAPVGETGAAARARVIAYQSDAGAPNLEATITARLLLRDNVSPQPLLDGSVDVNGADATLTIGDGTGSPALVLDKADTGAATVDFQSAGVTRWELQAEADEDFAVKRYDSSGVYVEDSVRVGQTYGTVLMNRLYYTRHGFSTTSTSKRYASLNTLTSNGSLSVFSTEYQWIAPVGGRLWTVKIRTSSAAGSTTIGLHKNLNGTASATVTQTVNAGTVTTFHFDTVTGSDFSEGDLLSISVDATTSPNQVTLVCVWKFEETA